MSYFEHIFKMTAWTEIRRRLHGTRMDWSVENALWTNGFQKCLTQCCGPNDDEFECCWASIQFAFMGSLRLGLLPLILRYVYIAALIWIIYYWSHIDMSYLYGYYAFVSVAAVEWLVINYVHHFVTMFKLKTLLKWGYAAVPCSTLTGLLLDDLIWFNAPPLVILDRQQNIVRAIGIVRHLLMLNSFKLSVMIVSCLVQINAERASYNVILSLVVSALQIVIVLRCIGAPTDIINQVAKHGEITNLCIVEPFHCF
eukprot:425690_1